MIRKMNTHIKKSAVKIFVDKQIKKDRTRFVFDSIEILLLNFNFIKINFEVHCHCYQLHYLI